MAKVRGKNRLPGFARDGNPGAPNAGLARNGVCRMGGAGGFGN